MARSYRSQPEGKRADGRGHSDVRQITCEPSVLPRTHGSAVFTRGETQALAVATLGSSSDEQKIDALEGESWKSYMLHYNFPPFSVGEIRPIRGPGRREIGHGALAEKSLQGVLPTRLEYRGVQPYVMAGFTGKWYSFGSPTRENTVGAILPSNGFTASADVGGGVTFGLFGLTFEVQVKDSINRYWDKTQHDLVFSGGLLGGGGFLFLAVLS